MTAEMFHQIETTAEFTVLALETYKERDATGCTWLFDRRIADLRRLVLKARQELYDGENTAKARTEQWEW